MVALAAVAISAITANEAEALPDCDPSKCACPDDTAAARPARRAAPAKSTPVCRDGGEATFVVDQAYGHQSDAVQLATDTSGTMEMTEGKTLYRAVKCVDIGKNGKETAINDEQRLRTLVESQIEVSINGVKVRITEVKMHAGQVLVYMNNFRVPGRYNVVIRSLTDGSRYEKNIKVTQTTATAAPEKSAKDGAKAKDGGKEEKKDSGKRYRFSDKDDRDTTDDHSDNTPTPEQEQGGHLVVGFAGQTDINEPSEGLGFHAGLHSKVFPKTSIGGDLQIDFMGKRAARVEGEDVTGAKALRVFPGVTVNQTLLGNQFNGGLVGLKAGPLLEFGNTYTLKDGRKVDGDSNLGVGIEGSAGGIISSLSDDIGARLLLVFRVEAPAQERMGEKGNTVRTSAGFTIDLVIHKSAKKAQKASKSDGTEE